MTAAVSAARAIMLADREFLYVNAVVGLVAVAASAALLHYGSFARALAAVGLSPAI